MLYARPVISANVCVDRRDYTSLADLRSIVYDEGIVGLKALLTRNG